MFGLFKQDCTDANFFGYICVALGAEYRMSKKEGRKFQTSGMFEIIELCVENKKTKLTAKQKSNYPTILLVVGGKMEIKDSTMLKFAESFSNAQHDWGFDFKIPEVNAFKAFLLSHGYNP
jgi:hypothetical protein